MFDWNDLKYFLAVAESGSTLAAAQALRVSQTTVARRIAALEAATGVTLFERRQAGYALTPTGEAMLASALAVRDSADRFGEAVGAQSRDAGGTVSLTTMEIIAITLLPVSYTHLDVYKRQVFPHACAARSTRVRAPLGASP